MDQEQNTGTTGGDGNTQNTLGGAQAQAQEAMHGLEAYLAPVFEKLPHLPEGGRKFLVDISPWIALIFGILGVLALIGMSGVGVLATMATMGTALPMLLSAVIGLISSVMLLMAFPGLKARAKKGWNMVFYSQVVSVVGGLVGVVMVRSFDIVGVAIGAFIGFYILFEIRSYYK